MNKARMAKRILLVEDDPDFLRLTRMTLEASGYRVDVAQDWLEAQDRIQENRPDLLILDLDLPEVSGEELALRLQQRIEISGGRIPTLIYSGRTPEALEEARIQAKANLALSKQGGVVQLLNGVRALLESAESQSQGTPPKV